MSDNIFYLSPANEAREREERRKKEKKEAARFELHNAKFIRDELREHREEVALLAQIAKDPVGWVSKLQRDAAIALEDCERRAAKYDDHVQYLFED
tara:strand:+ start:298 stop:585 length:288 start_codon:yes stop_codon:yes gene_type:complete